MYENEGHRYKRILVPFTDGRSKMLPISAELKKGLDSKGKSIKTDIEKAVTLAIIDEKWMEHLCSMDELKDSVNLPLSSKKDPLVIYKNEAYNLFGKFCYTHQ
ncbi:MAG: hypothetical protein R2769_11480 [Saprospiraceae bacterium]